MARTIKNNQEIFDKYSEILARLEVGHINPQIAKTMISALSGMQHSIVIEIQKTRLLATEYVNLEQPKQIESTTEYKKTPL